MSSNDSQPDVVEEEAENCDAEERPVSETVDEEDDDVENGGGSPRPCSLPAGGAVDQDLVNSPVLTLACGYLTAKLHMDRFYCPGIHQLCIEYNGQFLTPKQFTIVAAKDKQKDWKGAIKINRQPVRILFERNMLDFYKHNEYCSGRCVSKSFKPLIGAGANGDGSQSSFEEANANANGAATLLPGAVAGLFSVKSEIDDEPVVGHPLVQSQHHLQNHPHHRLLFEGSPVSLLARSAVDAVDLVQGSSLIYAEPLLFWNCICQLGLFDELMQEIEQQLALVKASFALPDMRAKSARKLSDLVRLLDIRETIQRKLIAKRSYADAQCAFLATELNELKRIAETREKKQREVKRKSELLDQLIGSIHDQKRKRRSSISNVVTDPAPPTPPEKL